MKLLVFSLFQLVLSAVTDSRKSHLRHARLATCTHNAVTSFDLINPEDNSVVRQLDEAGDELDVYHYKGGEFNIRANTCDGTEEQPVKCVKFWFVDVEHEERKEPYALFGDKNGDYNGGTVGGNGWVEDAPLKACTFTDDDCSEGESGCKVLYTNVNGCYHFPSFVIYDADSDEHGPYGYMVNQRQSQEWTPMPIPVCLPISGNVAITLSALECFEKVHFKLEKHDQGDSFDEKTENKAPFSLYGNRGSDLFGRELPLGYYTISAEINDEFETPSFDFEFFVGYRFNGDYGLECPY